VTGAIVVVAVVVVATTVVGAAVVGVGIVVDPGVVDPGVVDPGGAIVDALVADDEHDEATNTNTKRPAVVACTRADTRHLLAGLIIVVPPKAISIL
jgi:hypothetical protein